MLSVMRIFRPIILLIVACVQAGCTAPTGPTASTDGVLVSHLTQARVKALAAAEARRNGFAVDATGPWTLSLDARQTGAIWTAMLQEPGKNPPGYWLQIADDDTGRAGFVMPQLKAVGSPAGSDWLIRVQEALATIKYPIVLEDFLREAHLTGIENTGGGTAPDGRFFLTYTLHQEKDSPVRFEVECYYTAPDGWTGRKMVHGAELTYWDAARYRYVLRRENP